MNCKQMPAKWLYLGIMLSLSLSVTAAPKVMMSYNVRHGAGLDFKMNPARQIEVIKAEHPDFVGLQEVDVKTERTEMLDSPAVYAKGTGLEATFAKAVDCQGGDYGVMVLSKTKPLSVERLPLPGSEKRVLLVCEFPDCYFATTHLCCEAADSNRLASVAIIKGVVQRLAKKKPFYLTGDWNDVPASRTLAAISEFMQIISAQYGVQTYHGSQQYDAQRKPYDMKNFCIDYIAVDKNHALPLKSVKTHVVEARAASDHVPQVVKFTPTVAPRSGTDIAVDFANELGELNPKLHAAGWGPRIYPRAIRHDEPDILPLNLYAARTHDWALLNQGQRIVDTHFIFPLMHLDAKDPKNYYFKPTDDVLDLSRKCGMKLFYRLGTSIEHTEEHHYNILPPADYAKYAEVLAGIMRHYLKGWANGYEWAKDFDGWEIWNEPDGISNCWGGNGMNGKQLRDEFIKFFVTVFKRLKAEFPDQQIGGPALCWANKEYFTALLNGCKEAGVVPDFVSWHAYNQNGDSAAGTAFEMRKLLDSMGFTKTRLILNEWHYIRTWDGIHGRDSTPAAIRRAHEGPSGHLNIDSAAYNLRMLIGMQSSPLDEAFYYGCGVSGNWGFLDGYGQYNKCWYSMKLFGDFLRQTKTMVAVSMPKHLTTTVAVLAGYSADRKTASLLLVDYRGKQGKFAIDLHGLPTPKQVEAVVLDHTQDLAPTRVAYNRGVLTLSRKDENSTAFLVTLELAK